MIVRHDDHPNLLEFRHPLIRDKLTRARDEATPSGEFRRLINEIAGLMTFEICADLPLAEVEINTPLEAMVGARLEGPVTLVPILRAGLGMTDGILQLLPEARVGHIGLYRDEVALEPVPYYCKLPERSSEGTVLVVDPMVATGGSAAHALTMLKQQGCDNVKLVCIVAAPAGVATLLEHHPDVPVFCATLDRELDDKGYILPGLGDAGDRLFGTT